MKYEELIKSFGKIKKIKYKALLDEVEKIGIMDAGLGGNKPKEDIIAAILEDGRVVGIPIESIIEVGRCRPSKELKESLLEAYNNEKELHEAITLYHSLNKNIEDMKYKRKLLLENVVESKGIYTPRGFSNKVIDMLSEKGISLEKYEGFCNEIMAEIGDYTMSFIFKFDELTAIKFQREENIEKYCTENSYPFIIREYDGNLFVSHEMRDSKEYKAVVDKYASNNRKFKSFDDRHSLDIGDKNTLIYTHIAIFDYNMNLNKENLNKIVNFLENTLIGNKKKH